MSDGIANHAENSRAPVQFMRTIKMLQFVKRHLPRSGRCGHRRVRQRAAFSQRKNAAGRPTSPMGTAMQFLERRAHRSKRTLSAMVRACAAILTGVHLAVRREMDRPGEFRSSLEIV